MSTVTIELPTSLRERLESIAKREGISLNELLVEMAAKISANPALDKVKSSSNTRDTSSALKKLLRSVPDVEPIHPDDVIKQ